MITKTRFPGDCYPDCKPRWVKGKGSFKGWRLLLCKQHQIIHKMKQETK